jgi:hypothetical protein
MKMSGLISIVVLLASGAISLANTQSCKACNCQYSNVHALSEIVETKVKSILAKEPSKLFMQEDVVHVTADYTIKFLIILKAHHLLYFSCENAKCFYGWESAINAS